MVERFRDDGACLSARGVDPNLLDGNPRGAYGFLTEGEGPDFLNLYTPQQRKTDNTLIQAVARACRCKRMLESGEFATVAELAEREGIAPS